MRKISAFLFSKMTLIPWLLRQSAFKNRGYTAILKSRRLCWWMLTLSIVSVSGAEDYSRWPCYRDITVNTASSGAAINEEVLNFPLLVRLTQADSSVFSAARTNGADIRFSKITSGIIGPHFSYQIETWDNMNKRAAIWVLVDTVKKNNQSPMVRMYWGKDGANDGSDGARVFDTAGAHGFRAVWHLNEGIGDTIRDATFNNYKGAPLDTLNAGLPANAAGMIGWGKRFTSASKYSGSYYRILHSASGSLNFDTLDAYSISAWVNIDTVEESGYFISKGQYNLISEADGNLTFSETRGGISNNRNYVHNHDAALGGKKHLWRHIVGVHKAGEKAPMLLYVDGAIAGDTVLTISADPRNTGYDVRLGKRQDKNTGWFAGSMDEVRFENIARSADWINLCFRTQKDDSIVIKGPVLTCSTAVAPAITSQTGNLWLSINSLAGKFWVRASGPGTLTYGWKKDGSPIASADRDTLILDAARKEDDGAVYSCSVANAAGSISSAACTLHVVAAIFGANPISGNDTLTVAFLDSSVGAAAAVPLRRKWSFGDGDSSAIASPAHFYSKPGAYTVKLIVSAVTGIDSMEMAITINRLALKADFKADTTTAAGPLQVTFADFSLGTIFNRRWIFGDGETLSDTGKRGPVVHTFAKAGSFTVKLIANGPAGSDTMVKYDYVFIAASTPLRFVGVSIDSGRNVMAIHWMVDTSIAGKNTLDAGISWSTAGYRTDCLTAPDTIKRGTAMADSISLQLGEGLLFDTTYYVTLSLRKEGKAWLPLSDSSRGAMKTPAFNRQNIIYGINRKAAYADNKCVRITVDTAFPLMKDNNTVALWKRPDSIEGFIAVSKGYEFLIKNQSAPLNIGLKCGAIQKKDMLPKAKIYRYKNNQWFLERSPQWTDMAEGYVVATTDDIGSPFIAMIDTLPPAIAVLSHPEKAVLSNKQVIDEFIIKDNIANASWKFHYAKGGYAFDEAHCDAGIFSSCSSRKSTYIPESYVSAEQGVRAVFSVSDGVSEAVLNVSRKVIRDAGVETVSTEAMKWTPLFVTAHLDSPKTKNALRPLTGEGTWAYDNTKFRLFRWLPFFDKAKNRSDKYVEYSDGLDSLFSFEPGRLFWLKTRKSMQIDFGKGVTPDLTKPYALPLQACSWNDISLPFNFDIKAGDVLDATNNSGQAIDSLRFCVWSKDSMKNYTLDEMYFPSLGDHELQDRTMSFVTKKNDNCKIGYSVYNAAHAPCTLYIPPIPAVTSGYVLKAADKKDSVESKGVIIIEAQTPSGYVTNTIYCGLIVGKRKKLYFPAAPSFEDDINIRVCDEQMRQFGHLVAAGTWDKDDGVSCYIAVNNHSDRSEQIKLTASWKRITPPEIRFMLFDPSGQAFKDDGHDSSVSMQIADATEEIGYCQLIVGGQGFLTRAKGNILSQKTAFIGMHTNPSGHSVRIRLCLSVGVIRIVKLAIFDAIGREVWNFTMRGHGGVNDFIWPGINKSGRFSSSGVYIVQMSVFNSRGDKKEIFEKKLTYLP